MKRSQPSDNNESINRLIDIYLQKKHDHDAYQLFSLVQNDPQYVDERTQQLYNKTLRMCLKEDSRKAAKFYNLSKNGVFKLDVISGNQLIDQYANKGDTTNALAIYKKKQFVPDRITFNSLMKAGVIARQKEFIHEIFLEMKSAKLEPDGNLHKHCWKIVKNEWGQPTEESTRQDCRSFYSTCKRVDDFSKFAFSNPLGFATVQANRMKGSSTIAGDPKAKKMWEKTDNWLRKAALERKPVTLDFFREINRSLGGSGVFRGIGEEVSAGGSFEYIYAPGEFAQQEMENFCEWLNKSFEMIEQGIANPIETAARAAQRFVSIHPFRNENGRSSRHVMDYILERYGLLPAAVGNDILYGIFIFAQNTASPSKATESVLEGVRTSYHLLQV